MDVDDDEEIGMKITEMVKMIMSVQPKYNNLVI